MTSPKPSTRAPKPNQHARAGRQTAIDALLRRALRGELTIPEAAVLTDYVQTERRIAELTRQQLTDTTRALQRHRGAADEEIQRLEALVEQHVADPAEEEAA